MRLSIFLIFLSIFIVLSSNICVAECYPNQTIDIKSILNDGLTIICDTSSKIDAEYALNLQKPDGCFVVKEAEEDLYRVICPSLKVQSGGD